MEVIERNTSKDEMLENDGMCEYEIVVNGVKRIHASDYGEPEDNSLSRDLKFVFDIVKLMRESYNAGKNGEDFNIKQEELLD